MRKYVFIQSGLLHLPSNGIIFTLAGKLAELEDVSVRPGTFGDYKTIAAEAKAISVDAAVFQIGHSLGASVAGQWARLAARRIDGIFGFDPASNPFADATEYRNTPIPKNVRFAKAYISTIPGLGGGPYTAESKDTAIENEHVAISHSRIDEWVEPHIEVVEFVRRYRAA